MRKTTIVTALLSAALLWAQQGCGSRDARPATPKDDVGAIAPASARESEEGRVSLIDSTRRGDPDDETGFGWVDYGVAVASTGVVDTIPGIRVIERPVLVGDTAVWGWTVENGRPEEGFAYDVRSKRLRRHALPRDLFAGVDVALSPDARHLAYIARTFDTLFAATIVAWPSGARVARAPWALGYPGDAHYSSVEWCDSKRFASAFRIESGTWVRFRGSVSNAATQADTVSQRTGLACEMRP